VQRNIAAFGGDPSQVTIFGQSAGAHSVYIHLSIAPSLPQKLFHRAIVMSSPITLPLRDATTMPVSRSEQGKAVTRCLQRADSRVFSSSSE
jgi:carboxylesterase type B